MTAIEFETAMAGFLAKLNEVFARAGFMHGRTAETSPGGAKFVRVLARDGGNGGRSAYCFVERATGNIFKPAGWKGPARNFPRGNIADEALPWCGPYGIAAGIR